MTSEKEANKVPTEQVTVTWKTSTNQCSADTANYLECNHEYLYHQSDYDCFSFWLILLCITTTGRQAGATTIWTPHTNSQVRVTAMMVQSKWIVACSGYRLGPDPCQQLCWPVTMQACWTSAGVWNACRVNTLAPVLSFMLCSISAVFHWMGLLVLHMLISDWSTHFKYTKLFFTYEFKLIFILQESQPLCLCLHLLMINSLDVLSYYCTT